MIGYWLKGDIGLCVNLNVLKVSVFLFVMRRKRVLGVLYDYILEGF